LVIIFVISKISCAPSVLVEILYTGPCKKARPKKKFECKKGQGPKTDLNAKRLSPRKELECKMVGAQYVNGHKKANPKTKKH
jgi:hypothetical protein